jgi:PEP-CTERM motif-containing protein
MRRLLSGLLFTAALSAPASAALIQYDFAGTFGTSDTTSSFAVEGGFTGGTGSFSGFIIFDTADPGPTDFTAVDAFLSLGSYSIDFADPLFSFAGGHVDPPEFSILLLSAEDFSAANATEFLSFLISFPTAVPGIEQSPDPLTGTVSINLAGDSDALFGTGVVTQLDVSAPPAIPEPSTWAMMIGGFGLAGMALRLRRRRYRVSPVA